MLVSPDLSPSLELTMTSGYDGDSSPVFGLLSKYSAASAANQSMNLLSNFTYTNGTADPNKGDHLSYGYLSFLTLQAVTQTVIICFMGFVAARANLLHPALQKQVSALNVQLLTPCLIFMKLASSLSLSALIDIALIPVFFVVATGISFSCAKVLSKWMKLNLQESNFVTAMAVFGNSNSLPVSLTVSLAYTLPNLKWPELENDDQDDVASRGLLYLLIFQQLGQIIRWSWGYNTLLAKPTTKVIIDGEDTGSSSGDDEDEESQIDTEESSRLIKVNGKKKKTTTTSTSNQPSDARSTATLTSGSTPDSTTNSGTSSLASSSYTYSAPNNNRHTTTFGKIVGGVSAAYHSFMGFMNPPLWSMLIAIFVASVPAIKHEIFYSDGFVQHTFTKSVQQVGGMAIPMSLLVLGSNFAPNDQTAPPSANYKKIVTASLLSRMVLPSMFLLPIIALSVKYINISILDDPIFLVVAFILTVAPPAIQLSQICQMNEIFEKEMAGVLFWGYVILTLPSTIIIVVASLEVLEWAGVTA